MRFINSVIREDIAREFPGLNIEFSENDGALDAVFRNDAGCDLFLHFGDNRLTLCFDKWKSDYLLTDDEYERLLWDIRDIVHKNAYAVSVMVGNNLYLSYLTRVEIGNIDDFMDDDPIENAGLRRTGAVISCVCFDDSRTKRFVLEKE